MKKNNFPHFWSFQSDKIETWAFWDSLFSKEECEKIIDIGIKKGLDKAVIKRGYEKNYRNSKISWIYPNDNFEWVFKRVTEVVLNLNKRFFNFDLYGFMEGFQFTHYKKPDGKYKKHIDKFFDGPIRKLSLSIQLSDPKSYLGGDFILHDGEVPITLPKEQGKLILFPSYVLHEVKPVTKGERYSLVAWITGPPMK